MRLGIFNFFLILLLLCLFLSEVYAPLRYLKYFLPVLATAPYLFVDKAHLDYKYFSYFFSLLTFYGIVIGYLFIKALLFFDFQVRFISNAVFILSPLSLIFLISPFFKQENISKYVKTAFFANVIIFLVGQANNLFAVLTNFSLLKEAILSSAINTENQLAFGLGLFLLYFITEKYPKRYIITCALLFILSFKRIAIGAFIFSYAYYLSTNFLSLKTEQKKYTFITLAIIANLMFIELVFLIVNGDLDNLIMERTSLSTNHLLMGRQTYYKDAIDKFGSISWDGIGLGQIDTLLFSKYGNDQILHSDILKNYFEFGVVIFVVWVGLLVYKTSFSRKAFSTFLYFNCLMLTDNVFIYFDFMFYFYFFIMLYLSERKAANANVLAPTS